MSDSMTITVAIITYERAHVLKRCLLSLANGNVLPDKILIIDSSKNAISAGDFLPQTLKAITDYRHITERKSIPEARNIALQYTTTDIITFIDDDATAEPTYVEAIKKDFEKYVMLGAVGGPTINATSEKVPFQKIIRDSKKRITILPWGEVRSDARRWIPTESVWVDGAQGGNMSYLTKVLRDVGGFDEKFVQPSFREESDVLVRLKKKGYRFLYDPQVFVYHMPNESGGISDFEAKERDYFFRAGINARRFADKHFPKWLSRLSWILWSRNPPALLLIPLATLIRKKPYIAWHKGLWKKPDQNMSQNVDEEKISDNNEN